MPRKQLRAVADDERAIEKPATIVAAVEMSERILLVALRDKLASDLDKGVPPHAVRGIVAELRDLDRSIRAIDSRDGGDEIGEAASTPDAPFSADAL